MAYTDIRYQLPNLTWLENETPKLFSRFEESKEKLYIVSFSTDDEMNGKFIRDKNLDGTQIKNLAEQLNHNDWVLLTAAGNESNNLICVCKAASNAEISRLTLEAVRKFGYIETDGSRILFQLKAGISHIDPEDLQKSMEQARAARRKSQREVMLFDAELQDELNFETQVEQQMVEALKNGEFQAWYQSEYEIKSKKPIGMEAFVRWQSPTMGFLLPEKFLPVFERNGFIIYIDYFIFEEVCKQQRKRLDEGKKLLPISVNQSALHITEEHYLEKMKKILEKYNLPKGMLKLEFSEQTFEKIKGKEQEKRVANIIRGLQKLGFKISIDRFGSGYSSYKMLYNLTLDEMKIDSSLLYSSSASTRARDILENIVQLGKKLGLKVVCEGIETKEQENLLTKLDCQFGQGFLNAELRPDADFPGE